MGRFKSKDELVADISKERRLIAELLAKIPESAKVELVTDGLTTKDLLAHRTEWGRMMLSWYNEARAGGTPAVPSERYKWNQLKELNADIFERFRETPLADIEQAFSDVHDELNQAISKMSEAELFTKQYYGFTGTSDLATYVNSATAAHDRSARRLIQRWWKAQQA